MALTNELALRGHVQAVLHVLADHHMAVHLYDKMGSRPPGEFFQRSLLRSTVPLLNPPDLQEKARFLTRH